MITDKQALALPLHLWGARHRAALNPASVDELLQLIDGQPVKRSFGERIRSWWCGIVGHDLVIDRWHRDSSTWWEDKDYEIHLGCRRCLHVLVLPASFEV